VRRYRSLSPFGLVVFASLTALCPLACGSEQTTVSSPPLSFSGPAAETVASASGQLTIGVRWSPAVPVKGSDAAELTLLDGAGNPVDGLTLTVVPWMPAHGHGTSIEPVTTLSGPGVEIATPVYLFMSGEWQLRMTITGAMNDSAIATVEIP
jgi:hypothetical protein